MLETIANYFDTSSFMPHGHCFFWSPSLLWIYVVSDLTIAASYFSIPFALWYFAQKRPDVPFRWIFVMFGAFVMACGTTHLFALWNIWHADYWADAGIKALTASVSIATAILLWPLIPKAITIPSHAQLENVNRELQSEVMRRTRAESALIATNDDLERRVAERTAELTIATDALRESEARFRSLTNMASDYYWESDAEHRLVSRISEDPNLSVVTADRGGAQIGKRRWESPYLSPDEVGWQAHRAELDAHRPFRNFEFSRLGADGEAHHIVISGDPVFGATGAFKGYRGVAVDISERKQRDRAMRESEAELRAIFDGALDGVLVADAETKQLLRANAAICSMLGYTPEEITRVSVSDIHPTQDLPRVAEHFERLLHGDLRLASEMPVLRKDGSVFYADIKASRIRVSGKDCLLGIFRDVTERKMAEARMQRQTQLYAALSQCNEAIVRCGSEKELFAEICRAAVQFGGMKMAWIGVIEPDTRMVRPVAGVGDRAEEYTRDIKISVDADSPLGQGTTGTAIRAGEPVWCQDFQNDPLVPPWRRESRARFGWGASAALPLYRNGVPFGALNLYAGEVGAFDEAARDLLLEMATDISFALDNFAREAARERAENELRGAEEQFRGLVEQSIAGIYIIQDGVLKYVNSRTAEIIGQGSTEELIGSNPLRWIIKAERAGVAENIRRLFDGEAQNIAYEFGVRRADGVIIQVGANAARATHQGRPAVIGMVQDISEKKRAEEEIQRYVAQLRTAVMSTVEVATALGEMRDPYTAGHEKRVGAIASAIGAELGFDDHRIEGLRVAGYLHDIGKITIPAEILSKPGKLKPIEYQLIQAHPRAGYDVLASVEFPWPLAEIALQHHERMDGSGYPQGLKGEAILFEARIMAVADVVEAMSSHRPYRAGRGIEMALTEIENGRATAYDLVVVDACLRMFREGRFQLPA